MVSSPVHAVRWKADGRARTKPPFVPGDASVEEPAPKLARGRPARLVASEPSVPIPRHEAVQHVPKPARQHAKHAEHGPREPHAPRDGEHRVGALECAIALDDHNRARRGGSGQVVTHLRARSARRVRLQRSETALRMRVTRDHEPHRATAEVAVAVEQDDGGMLGDRATTTPSKAASPTASATSRRAFGRCDACTRPPCARRCRSLQPRHARSCPLPVRAPRQARVP